MITAVAASLPPVDSTEAVVWVDPTTPENAQPAGAVGGAWTLDMSEEFNNPLTLLDEGRALVAFHPGGGAWLARYPWDTYTGGRVGATSHQLVAPYNTESVSVKDGSLVITGKRRPLPKNLNPDWPFTYTSGAITSFDFYFTTYGYFEARMKLPGDGISWPAFWLWFNMREAITSGAPPDEIDIMECFFSADEVMHNAHYEGSTVSNVATAVGVKNFNTFGCKWSPTELKWYVNGVQVASESNTAAIPDAPMFIILNHALKAPQTPDPAPETSIVEVDYVRVWKPA